MKAALFLDRDGIINKLVNYPSGYDSPQDPGDVQLVGGIVKIITWANKAGIYVVEVTNQPGVAKGRISQCILDEIENKVHSLLQEQGAKVNKIYRCQHHPKGIVPELSFECECRKPKPGLLLQAAKEMEIDLEKSVFLGDSISDVDAGRKVNCKTILFYHEEDVPEKVERNRNASPDYKADFLNQVIPILQGLLSF